MSYKCPHCENDRNLEEFQKSGWCKDCRNKKRREKYANDIEYRQYINAKNRAIHHERMKDPEYRKKRNSQKRMPKEYHIAYYHRRKSEPYFKELAVNNQRRFIARKKIKRPFFFWARGVIRTHKDKGFEVKVTIEELEVKRGNINECELCGLKFGDNHWNSYSLDRIANEPVLTLDNIRIICRRCNTMKGNQTDSELLEQCKRITNYALNRTNS